MSSRPKRQRVSSSKIQEVETQDITELRNKLNDHLSRSRTGILKKTSLGLFATNEFELGPNRVQEYALNRAGLVEYLISEAKKRENVRDYTPCSWAPHFKGPVAEGGYEAAQNALNVREKFNYNTTINTLLPEALQELYTGCYCWGELATVISPDSMPAFQHACFAVFNLLGDRLHLVPIMKVSPLVVFQCHLYAIV
jgi:hypothetical protein